MPGMNGVELVLHARELRPGLPAAVVTGFADAGWLARLPAGVPVLFKPFLRQDLLRVLAGLAEGTMAL